MALPRLAKRTFGAHVFQNIIIVYLMVTVALKDHDNGKAYSFDAAGQLFPMLKFVVAQDEGQFILTAILVQGGEQADKF